MSSSLFCSHCGFPLEPDVRFCRNCGQPVYQVPNAPPVQMSQPASPLYPPAAPARRQASKKPILLPIALILVGVCGLVVLIGAAAAGYYSLQKAPVPGMLPPVARSASTQTVGEVSSLPPTEQPSTTAPATPSPTETILPLPTQPEAPPPLPQTATETESVLTGEQSLADDYIFDDFLSTAFGWMERWNEEVWAGLESDAYTLHIRAAEQGAPAFLPVSFFPQAVEFDAIVPPDYIDGAFGVSCNYQDEDNFDFVSFATETSQYTIGQLIGDQLTTLTNPEWQSSTHMDASPPWSNHILVDCGGSMIAVFINNEGETGVALNPSSQPGQMAINAQSWENASGRGYKVYFDNLSAWKPVQ